MMDQPDLEAELHFSQPVRQVVLMLIVLALTGLGVFFVAPSVLPVFEANPWLNGFIFFVFVLGVLTCFWQVAQLMTSVRWIEAFVSGTETGDQVHAPQLLAPLATLLRSRGARMQIGATSTRSILDSVATRIDEAREITRYIVNLLIFLGLLGTFYGLATTVPALVETIRSLVPKEGEGGVEVFSRLMNGLEGQLSGMGVAFASSLLGLAGSLVVGLLELFAGHGQNRFYRELEEWLSSFTRLGFSSGDAEGGGEDSMALGVLDHMADQMEKLQSLFLRSEAGRSALDARMGGLADAVDRLATRADDAEATSAALMRIADGQDRLIETLEQAERTEGLDAESRMRLRSIDVQMLRILEEISAGRQESMSELRTDLAALTRALLHPPAGAAPVRPRRVTPHDPGTEG